MGLLLEYLTAEITLVPNIELVDSGCPLKFNGMFKDCRADEIMYLVSVTKRFLEV